MICPMPTITVVSELKVVVDSICDAYVCLYELVHQSYFNQSYLKRIMYACYFLWLCGSFEFY